MIIDVDNKFISITLKLDNQTFVFKDSMRIFTCSLNELCEVFNVTGKLSIYKDEYNSFDLFNKPILLREFIDYALQDSISLYNALYKAQLGYHSKYKVDITTIVSAPSLAFKIFRLNYLDKDIPILSPSNDNFIRLSYYGGSTDIYKCYGKNLYYYDINSLYPYAMLKDLPGELIRTYHQKDCCNINLDKFFGFLSVTISCPSSVQIPVLPYRQNGRTIYPQGIWTATYFSEELKYALTLGYQIQEIHLAKEFTKTKYFEEYVNEMYGIKATSKGSEKFIAKMLLNSLYGLFGRKKEVIESKIINKKELFNYVTTSIIKTIIDLDNGKCVILMISNLNPPLIGKLNTLYEVNFKNTFKTVKSNVAIASAITSYARLHMNPFKIAGQIYYSDTDSVITSVKLDSLFLSEGDRVLGLMKDELNGLTMSEAYFLGIKQYGYYYIDENGIKHEKSVWAGVERNSISFFRH